MSAAPLSVDERAVADAFGIQAKDACTEDHAQSDTACEGCDAVATLAVPKRCCGLHELLCAPCMELGRLMVEVRLAVLATEGESPICENCGRHFRVGATFDDIYAVRNI